MPVEFERQGRIALITLNRPEARNAINAEMAETMEAAIDTLENDDELWVGVLKAEGTVFSAGADLKEISRGNAAGLATKRGGFAGITRRERTKPLIAAVAGQGLAGGCEIALACDMIVCADTSRFGLPEVKRSLVAAAGGLFRLPRALGRQVANEAILTGDPISAERAFQLGMVNRVVPEADVVGEAVRLAEAIAVNAPLAVRESLAVANRAFTEEDDDLWRASGKAMGALAGTEDFAEGPRAFVEKRAPVWKGR